MPWLTIKDVNVMGSEQFTWMFGNVVELCSDAAVQLADRRPFQDVDQLCEAFALYLDQLSVDEKVNILRLHPDLAGKMAEQGELTHESTKEQASAGLDQLTPEEKNLISHYNKHYKDKFGFPFIICARENKVKSIIEGLMKRYNNVRPQEITTGIDEVKKICALRIRDLVVDK